MKRSVVLLVVLAGGLALMSRATLACPRFGIQARTQAGWLSSPGWASAPGPMHAGWGWGAAREPMRAGSGWMQRNRVATGDRWAFQRGRGGHPDRPRRAGRGAQGPQRGPRELDRGPRFIDEDGDGICDLRGDPAGGRRGPRGRRCR
jgi:hypothetical protein